MSQVSVSCRRGLEQGAPRTGSVHGDGGGGMDLWCWEQDTAIGTLRLYASETGVRHVDLPGTSRSVIEAHEQRDDEIAIEIDEYFTGRRRRFTVPIDLDEASADFHRRVLETLLENVGYGETVTYGELAEMAGRPGAARAVGAAMAGNPVPIVVPCHRVVASGGSLGGYGGGLPMKRALLALEGVDDS